jgi:bifunctional oligoribonuclease and PAP phosphatase NrnA
MYDAADAVAFIRRHDSFLVLGHKEPDGDCVASQLAAAALLEKLGKKVSLFSVGPFDRPEISDFGARFAPAIPAAARQGAAVIILDCSTPDRTGALGRQLDDLPVLVVDHHSSGTAFGTVRFVDPSAPSTTMLVNQLYDDCKVRPDADTARLLLFGLCTDTGFFRHLSQRSADTFRAVADLVATGTSTADVYMMVYGKRSLSSRKLLADMLGRTESWWNDRLLLSWQTMDDRARRGALQRGEDDLYRLLQTIRGNVVVAFVKEERAGGWSVGLRSTAAVDVGAIAGSFGGGGHKQAAGFDIEGTLESVKAKVLATFEPLLAAQ